MTTSALVIYGIFALFALGLRTLLHVRATGRWPLLIPRTPAAWIGEASVTIGLFGGPAGAVLDLAEVLDRISLFDHSPVRAIGLAGISLGVAGVIVAQVQMGASWRAGVDPSERTNLVTAGLFARVRNPIYSSMIVAGAGLALVAPNVVTFASVALSVIGSEVLVRRVEEPYLLSAHGQAFADYAARTGRFVPGLGFSDERRAR